MGIFGDSGWVGSLFLVSRDSGVCVGVSVCVTHRVCVRDTRSRCFSHSCAWMVLEAHIGRNGLEHGCVS